MVSVPIFVFFVIHLSGHAVMLFLEHDHRHEAHAHVHAEHFWESVITLENFWGLLGLLVFIWIWHRPVFHKWVPCRHDHCHRELPISHLLAIVAFCLHFFPEAAVRHHLIEDFSFEQFTSFFGAIGFLSHFLVDIIIAVVLSSYFAQNFQRFLSFLVIVSVWILALFSGEHFGEEIPPVMEGLFFLLSAFLLAMFVHRPHKPKICKQCREH